MAALAMILAGGEGTRLMPLTSCRSKPAVPFGGSYRLIDFVLNNFVNSGIIKIFVITQYKSQSLLMHLKKGWQVSGIYGAFIDSLPAQMRVSKEWYQGTADAIYQNLTFIQEQFPDHVCIFGSDHIYKMNIRDMLTYHKNIGADLTVAAIRMKSSECAGKFGVVEVDENNKMIGFEEKPAHPKELPNHPGYSLVSMGNYIFKADVLCNELVEDELDKNSSHDFGKDIIPTMLNDGKSLYAYKFKGYWKDVGTIDSLWEANMDLLDKNNKLDLNDPSWKIYTEDATALPQYVGADAVVERAFITQGCVIDGEVKNSVLFTGAKVAAGAKVIDSVLMPGAEVAEGAVVTRALVADGIKIGKNAVVGDAASENIELVAKRVKGDE